MESQLLFATLPNEMLAEVLLHLPVMDLLNCRLVSTLWKGISTSVCQRRYVHLKGRSTYSINRFKRLHSTFEHVQDLPWSYATFQINRDKEDYTEDYYEQIRHEEKFIRVFGSRLKKIHLTAYDFPALMDVIKGTPNVEVIVSRVGLNGDENWELLKNYPGNVPLTQLRHLEGLVLDRCTAKFFESLLAGAGSKLSYVKLTIFQGGSEFVDKVAKLLVRVPNISLFCNNITKGGMYDTFAAHKLAVRELEINCMSITHAPCLKKFLLAMANHLNKLKLTANTYGYHLLTIPVLPSLKRLTLNLGSFDFIKPFATNQFPVLETVHLSLSSESLYLFKDAIFESVKEVHVCPYVTPPGKQVFPNVLKFGTEVDEPTYH